MAGWRVGGRNRAQHGARSSAQRGARSSARRIVTVIAVALVAALAPTVGSAAPASAATYQSLSDSLSAAQRVYHDIEPTWRAFPDGDLNRWRAANQAAAASLASARHLVSTASSGSLPQVSARVATEVARAATFRKATLVVSSALAARGSASAAGQAAFSSWLAGTMSADSYQARRAAFASVATWAADDLARARAALGTTKSVSAARSPSAWAAAKAGRAGAVAPGWTGVPGGCALPSAPSNWLGAAAKPGLHLWVDDQQVASLRSRIQSGNARAAAADAWLRGLSTRQRDPLPTNAAAAVGAFNTRAQRLGYAALMGDEQATAQMRSEVASMALAGPRTDSILKTVATMEAIATDLDWLGLDTSSAASAQRIREALLVRWVGPVSCLIDDRDPRIEGDHNYPLLINSSEFMAGIALAAHDSDVAAAVARAGLTGAMRPIRALVQDGGSFEGPTYLNMQAHFLAGVYGSVAAAYGPDAPVTLPDPTPVAAFAWNSVASDRLPLAFADADYPAETLKPGLSAWVAHTSCDPYAGALARRWIVQPTEAFQTLWWPCESAVDAPLPERVSMSFPRTGISVLHRANASAWLRSGSSNASHAHLDMGSVDYRAGGVRWTTDTGKEDYSRPGYFALGPTSKRWTYFKSSAYGHSTLRTATVGGQRPAAAPLVAFSASTATARVDLHRALPGSRSAIRSLHLTSDGQAVITDTITASSGRTWSWQWLTDASVRVSGSGSTRTATLVKGGKTLRITLSGVPAGSRWSAVAAPSYVRGERGGAVRVLTLTTPSVASLHLTATAALA